MNNKIWKDTREGTIILNKYFCFIQIPKTSSTNFNIACEKKGLTTKLPCYRHEGLLYIEEFIGNYNLPIYTIVRNPFMHIYSYFFHKIRYNEIKLDPTISTIKNFESFCKKNVDNIHLRQCDYIKSNKNLKVTFFKYEENKINAYILQRHNIDLQLSKTHYMYNKFKEGYNVYDFFKNQAIVDLIIETRHKEFALFNYSTKVTAII